MATTNHKKETLKAERLITDHLDIWTSAIEQKSSAGRGSSKKFSLHGIKKLRELILELAVRGKLVEQNASDEPASVLLERIATEKAQLLQEGKIKKPKILPEITEDEKPFELPDGWEFSRFIDILDFSGGGQPPKSVFSEEKLDGYVQLIQIRDLGVNPQPVYVPKDKVSKFCTINDVMVGRYGASVGKVFWGKEGAYNVALIRIHNELNAYHNGFVYQLLKSPLGQKMFTGISRSAQDGFNKDDIAPCILPLPPVEEQHRIVAKVDELMSLCDALEAQTESSLTAHQTLVETLLNALLKPDNHQEAFQQSWQRISEHFDTLFTTNASIDTLKQTILQLAVMGKLVPQNPSDEPAAKLLERIAAEKAQLIKDKKIKKQKPLPDITDEEKPFELPKGWEWCRVWQIAELITSGSRDWAKYYADTGAIFVTMGNLAKGDYKLRLEALRYVSPPIGGEGLRTKLIKDDLLISITGDVGNLGLIPDGFGEAYINQHTCLLRFMHDCKNRYFPELMRSPLANFQFNAPQRGIKNSFRLGDVGEMIIPIPPLEEQHRIVAKVDELMALCDQLKTRLTDAQTTQVQLADGIVEQAL
ncbi:restriction endonuclease subunit S [Marinomonas sp. NPDC078689]|uniref:restriction endonuclease subunit S n=1 Tax=Marinomonas sp. NPDC078689 TaxID=3364147 RepID=UPI0037CACC03